MLDKLAGTLRDRKNLAIQTEGWQNVKSEHNCQTLRSSARHRPCFAAACGADITVLLVSAQPRVARYFALQCVGTTHKSVMHERRGVLVHV